MSVPPEKMSASQRYRTLFPTEPGTMVYKHPTTGQPLFSMPVNQAPPPAPVEPPGTAERAIKRGSLNVASDFATSGGLIAEAFGADEFSQAFYAKADEYANRAAEYQPTIGGIENINGLGDIATYGFEVLVENAPMLASMAIPGGLVSKAAQMAGAGARAAGAAGASAAFLSNVGLQTGESGNIARETGNTPVDARVVGSGIGKAALDFVPLLSLARRFGLAKNVPLAGRLESLIVGKLAEGGFIRRAAGNAAAIVAREVPTEVAQEAMNIALKRTLEEYEGALSEEEVSQLLNAAAGATVFGILGIPAAIVGPRPAGPPSNTEDRTPAGVDGPGAAQVASIIDNEVETFDTTVETGADINLATSDPVGSITIDATEPMATLGSQQEPLQIVDAKLPPLEPIPAEDGSPSQQLAAQVALEQEPTDQMYDFVLDESGGMQTRMVQDPMTQREEPGTPIADALNRTAEQLEVGNQYPQYLDVDPESPEGQSLAALHPGLNRLIELKADVLNNEENYRQSDGVLKKAARNRVDVLDQRIFSLEERLGLNPAPTPAADPTTVPEAQAEPNVEPAPANSLTPGQRIQLEGLAEKEAIEGLTATEFDKYYELQQISVGALPPSGQVVPESAAQKKAVETELEEVAAEVQSDETVRTMPAGTRAARGKGLSLEKAAKALNRFRTGMNFGPSVRVVGREHPEAHKKRKRFGGEMFGWWDMKTPGEVVIVADNHSTTESLLKTYLHESLAHYGLRTILSESQLAQVLKSMINSPPGNISLSVSPEALMQLDRGKVDMQLMRDAEEHIAQMAERIILDPNSRLVQMAWWKRLVAYIRQAARKMMPSVRFTSNDIHYMLRDVSKVFTGQVTQRYSPGEGGLLHKEAFAKAVGLDGPAGELHTRQLNSMLGVWGANYRKWFFTPLQFAAKYNVPGSQQFLENVQQWWARKRNLTNDATLLATEIQRHSPKEQQQLAKAVLSISVRSDELGRRLTEQEIAEEHKNAGIEDSPALQSAWKRMDDSFQVVVQQLRHSLEQTSIRIHGHRVKNTGQVNRTREETMVLHKEWVTARKGTPTQRKALQDKVGISTYLRLNEIDESIRELENRNYFPRMRFGQHAITIRARKDLNYEGKPYKGPGDESRGQVVYFETVESDRVQVARFKELSKQFPEANFEMQAGKLTDQEFHFMGTMSPDLYEKILDIVPNDPDNSGMREQIRELYLQQAPGRAFLRHLTKRKGIEGYSADVLRVYSSYMMNVANHIARAEWHLDMRDNLKEISDNAATVVPDARIAGTVRDYFLKQYEYIMNPSNEWARARQWGFLWYLGFNVKSAMVNLTQVPMVAYPYLASRYGDARSSAALLDAMQQVTRSVRGNGVYSKEIREAVNRGEREGFLEESRATELAAMAENSVLQRLNAPSPTARMMDNASYYGSWLFQKAERFNRDITFIAAYNLAKSNGVKDPEAAFKLARQAVQTSMFEYSKWNRAPFMRGKKSVMFLFWQFMQGMAYMGFGGAGAGSAMRLWMMLLLAGGLQGLPFAENMFDLLDFVGTKSKERLGMANPRVDLRTDLRQLASEITDNPDMVMHGLSRQYGLGPVHLLELLDVPVPNVDISGSLSAGRVIPGTGELGGQDRDPNAALGRAVADIAGPVAGMGYQFWRAATDGNPDTWKRWERTMPTALGNVSKSLRRMERGEESFRGGGTQTQFDVHNVEERAELIAQFLGFSTTRVNQRYEGDFALRRMTEYWAIRRALVMENIAYARMSGDQNAVADSWKALRRFNDSVPAGELRVNGTQLLQSLKQRYRRASLRTSGIPSALLFRRISQDMKELYPDSAAEIE